MTGLSKAGVCKNASGHFYLSTSISYIFCPEFICTFFNLYIYLYIYIFLDFCFRLWGENVFAALKKKKKKERHAYICPVLFLVPATEIEDKCAIYKI